MCHLSHRLFLSPPLSSLCSLPLVIGCMPLPLGMYTLSQWENKSKSRALQWMLLSAELTSECATLLLHSSLLLPHAVSCSTTLSLSPLTLLSSMRVTKLTERAGLCSPAIGRGEANSIPKRHHRRLHSAQLHSGLREGLPGGRRRGPADRTSDSGSPPSMCACCPPPLTVGLIAAGRARDADGRRLAPGRFVRVGVPDRVHQRVQAEHA